MSTNPYESPRTTESSSGRSSVYKSFARITVFIYGILMSSMIGLGTVLDLTTPVPVYETLYRIFVGFLMCYGVLALAIRRLRIPSLKRFWHYFALALPVLFYLDICWEIYKDQSWEDERFTTNLVSLVVISMPIFICNWMLRSRIHRRTSEEDYVLSQGQVDVSVEASPR